MLVTLGEYSSTTRRVANYSDSTAYKKGQTLFFV